MSNQRIQCNNRRVIVTIYVCFTFVYAGRDLICTVYAWWLKGSMASWNIPIKGAFENISMIPCLLSYSVYFNVSFIAMYIVEKRRNEYITYSINHSHGFLTWCCFHMFSFSVYCRGRCLPRMKMLHNRSFLPLAQTLLSHRSEMARDLGRCIYRLTKHVTPL